jgi:hypothetical protein
MEGPLLLIKSWALTAVLIWAYQRWFQRVAPPVPAFEAFCKERPLVAALWGVAGSEAQVLASVRRRLHRQAHSVGTLGTYPWPFYRLELAVSQRAGLVLLHIQSADVKRTRDAALPGLAHLLRDVLNELPAGAGVWLHAGLFDNGLVSLPPGGWQLLRGDEKRPQLAQLENLPPELAARPSLVTEPRTRQSQMVAQRPASSAMV